MVTRMVCCDSVFFNLLTYFETNSLFLAQLYTNYPEVQSSPTVLVVIISSLYLLLLFNASPFFGLQKPLGTI